MPGPRSGAAEKATNFREIPFKLRVLPAGTAKVCSRIGHWAPLRDVESEHDRTMCPKFQTLLGKSPAHGRSRLATQFTQFGQAHAASYCWKTRSCRSFCKIYACKTPACDSETQETRLESIPTSRRLVHARLCFTPSYGLKNDLYVTIVYLSEPS